MLGRLGLAKDLRRVRVKDIDAAIRDMLSKTDPDHYVEEPAADAIEYPLWTVGQARAYAAAKPGRCVLILEDFVVDATKYMVEHVSPGESSLCAYFTDSCPYSRVARNFCDNTRYVTKQVSMQSQ